MKTPSYQVVPLRWDTSDGIPVCLESRLALSFVGIRLESGLDSLHTSIVRIVNPGAAAYWLLTCPEAGLGRCLLAQTSKGG
jgi:hypothetical protein